jgi:hypothetical protein
MRSLFKNAFNTPYYTEEQGKEVAKAFKDILIQKTNEE